MADVQIEILVNALSETMNTKGWDNPEFGEILANLTWEWEEAIVPRRPYIPNMPQANGQRPVEKWIKVKDGPPYPPKPPRSDAP